VTCRELADFIVDYLNGDLAPSVKTAFEYHLSLCPNCVNYLATYQATIELGRRAFAGDDDPSLQMPEELVRAILASRQR
jgi:anti-sigma factor RsiW